MRLSDILESDHGIHPASRFAVATECQRVNGEIMNEEQFRSDNHYLPCLYLKHFATSNERVSVYRTLVAHDRFPMWREKPIKGVAYRAHLYTRLAAGRETDDIEKWLDREFEAPAASAIQKVTSEAQLKPEDWVNLARFVAAQDVRTPARLGEFLTRCHAGMQNLLDSVLQDSVRELQAARDSGESVVPLTGSDSDFLPLRVIAEAVPGEGTAKLGLRAVVGRGLWLFAIRHWLTETLEVLHQHKWSILTLPHDMNWFTSDDPVIRLNYDRGKYDFKGNWGSPGTEILLPLSPRYLLYTQIGRRPPARGTTMPRAQAELIRQFIAEHAYRMIFAASPEQEVPRLRPRLVNGDLIREEEEQWRRWHEEQTVAERNLMGPIET